jgi:hypothetical protein
VCSGAPEPAHELDGRDLRAPDRAAPASRYARSR